MNLRPYQAECVERVFAALAKHRSALAVLATGLGKTVLFSEVVRRTPSRCMVIAHREELVGQAAEKIAAATGERPGVEMASFSASRQRVVVATVQTLQARAAKFDPADFGLLVVDEAHHAVAPSYRAVVAHFARNPASKLLGVTATPKRADQLAMGQVFEAACYEYGIEAAIDDGWLVPVSQKSVRVEGLDFSKVKVVAGDFAEGELEKIMAEESVLHACAAPIVASAGDLPTLVFCVNVNHARLMAAVLERYKRGSRPVALSGAAPKDDRRREIAKFKAGETQFLCNCNLFLEGFDAPATSCVVMARPTKSLTLYTQVLGRGTRPLPGVVDAPGLDAPAARRDAIAASGKPGMLVLDFVGNSGEHQIVTAADLLGGKYGSPVVNYAKKTSSMEERPAPVSERLARACVEMALEDEIVRERRREQLVARAEFELRDVSPFVGGPRSAGLRGAPRADPATPKQVNYLVYAARWARPDAQALSKTDASRAISHHKFATGQQSPAGSKETGRDD